MINLFFASLITLAGAVMNMSVILANGGMPVVGLDVVDGKWIPATATTKLALYGDWIKYLTIGDTIFSVSIGDITQIIGGIMLGYFTYKSWKAKWQN